MDSRLRGNDESFEGIASHLGERRDLRGNDEFFGRTTRPSGELRDLRGNDESCGGMTSPSRERRERRVLQRFRRARRSVFCATAEAQRPRSEERRVGKEESCRGEEEDENRHTYRKSDMGNSGA